MFKSDIDRTCDHRQAAQRMWKCDEEAAARPARSTFLYDMT